MKVILKEDVPKLGQMGDVAEVARGYARNFLFPRKLAVAADERNIKALEHEKRVILGRKGKVIQSAQEVARKIQGLTLTIPVQAGEEQPEEPTKIFGAVTSKAILEALGQLDIQLDRKNLLLEKPIKQLGDFSIAVKIHPEVTADLKVSVVRSDDQAL